MMADISNKPVEQVEGLFCNEVGYQTPKIDTRAAIFKEDKILLVQEKNGTWSLLVVGVMSMSQLWKIR